MESDSAIDLSLTRGSSPNDNYLSSGVVPIVRPTPRPPWSILWYQNLWSLTASNTSNDDNNNSNTHDERNNSVNSNQSFSVLNSLNTNQTTNAFTPAHQQEECQHSLFRLISDNRVYYNFPTPQYQPQQSMVTKKKCGVITPSNLPTTKLVECSSSSTHPEEDDNSESDNLENIIVAHSPCSEDSIKSLPKSTTILDHHQATVILDIACCDGPVQFKRISNPNFALTVEHANEAEPESELPPSHTRRHTIDSTNLSKMVFQAGKSSGEEQRETSDAQTQPQQRHSSRRNSVTGGSSTGSGATLKTYLCIYCNQSFKSLFCYQKHKKRHLNPVSVDITTTTASSTSQRGSTTAAPVRGGGHHQYHSNSHNHNNNKRSSSADPGGDGGVGKSNKGSGGVVLGLGPEMTKAKTKDLNVQFFPCKKCGCKFPSYYFVHKHRKICH